MKVNDKVNYKSDGRPYLKDTSGTILGFNTTGTSAKVEFVNSEGREYTEWVGVGALEVVSNDPIKIALSALLDKKAEKEADLKDYITEYDRVSAHISLTHSEIENLENAIDALRELV